ncbi:MAG: hypothetical protein ACYC6M_15745 [Terriglobales bacterium]
MSPKNPTDPTSELPTGDELASLLQRAQKGDQSVLPQLHQVLNASPDIWRHYGDMSLQAEGSLIKLAAGTDLLLSESLVRKVTALKSGLAGPSPSPLEQLLVERITACWMQIQYYDTLVAQAGGASEARSKMLQRHQEAAHRRHLAAIKALATVRKLVTSPISPVEIASRLDGTTTAELVSRLDRRGTLGSRDREGIAGAVPVCN